MAAFGVATLSGLIAVDGEQKNLRFHRLPRVSRAMMLSGLLLPVFFIFGIAAASPALAQPHRIPHIFFQEGRTCLDLERGALPGCVLKARTSGHHRLRILSRSRGCVN